MDPGLWATIVHANTPHTKSALYLAAAVAAVVSILSVYLRCRFTGAARHLPNGWLVRTATFAAPIPVYVILLVVPFDPDLVQVLREDQIVVAIAGLYGLVETIKDMRTTAGEARRNAGHKV